LFYPIFVGGLRRWRVLAWVQLGAADRIGFELATSRGPKYGEAEREHGRIAVEDPAFTQQLWEALKDTLADTEVSQERQRAVQQSPERSLPETLLSRKGR
jgi:hypothetical protein